ncbi:MAG: M56 family metallopeptidase [Lachnospiraceae bacterium]|nr:M56 family metallopeptidase [Lachnospiraceae bacterium]
MINYGNIWGFLLQTCAVSIAAAFLLILKHLFAKTLSPRWQYAVWGLLALRILLPVSISRYVLIPISVFLETIKGIVERALDSAYAGEFWPISVKFGISVPAGPPQSITDWLFLIWLIGMLVCLLRLVLAWMSLHVLVRGGHPVTAETQSVINGVSEKYHLKSCRAITVPGLTSAFLCGVLHPILVLPEGTDVDEKVILHELMHRNHLDVLQNWGWNVLRAVHWCNPFLQYVFHRIGNDMEALCDQRVLECLEGEERREYGRALLAMANERYAHTPGTTSWGNGGKNIARRIGSIAHFKKYPAGMALVSVCIFLVLLCPIAFGTTLSFKTAKYYYPENTGLALERSLAVARLDRCDTVEEALETYATGLLKQNGIYIAVASPLSAQEELAERMRDNAVDEDWLDDMAEEYLPDSSTETSSDESRGTLSGIVMVAQDDEDDEAEEYSSWNYNTQEVREAYYLDAGEELRYVEHFDDMTYVVDDLTAVSDTVWEAVLQFTSWRFYDEEGNRLMDEDGVPLEGYVRIPVTITREENAWVVEESGEREVIYCELSGVNGYWWFSFVQ